MASQTGDPSSTSNKLPLKTWVSVVQNTPENISTKFGTLEEAMKSLKDREKRTREAEEINLKSCFMALYEPDRPVALAFKCEKFKIEPYQMSSFRKMKSISHKTLLTVLDIVHENTFGAEVVCPRLCNLEDFQIDRHASFYCCKGQFNTLNFRFLISSIIEGIAALHAQGLIHGNIQMASVFVSDGVIRPIYQLGKYVLFCPKSELEKQKRKDFTDLGELLKTMMSKICSSADPQNRSALRHPEFAHLAKFLLDQKNKLREINLRIYYHPAFMTLSDKANFTIQAFEFLANQNMGPELDCSMISNDWSDKIPFDLRQLLIDLNAISEMNSPQGPIIVRGLINFFKCLKNCLRHHESLQINMQKRKLVVKYPDGGDIANFDSWESVVEYFMALLPGSIMSLWVSVVNQGFYYSSRILIGELNDPVIITFHGSQRKRGSQGIVRH